MTTKDKNEAWVVADALCGTYLRKDEDSSKTAGYPIYRNLIDYDFYYTYVCDLGNRLEVNLKDGRSYNIWFLKV